MKLDRESFEEMEPKPPHYARLKTCNSFPINKAFSKNRARMRGLLVAGSPQARQLPYNMGYRSESRTFVYLPEA